MSSAIILHLFSEFLMYVNSIRSPDAHTDLTPKTPGNSLEIMMRMKITEANRVAINALLDKINGNAGSHTAFHKHVFDLAQSSELQLEKFQIAKKDRSNAKASGMSGGNVPSAYKYSRIVNTYEIKRGAADWFLVDVKRIDVYGNARKDRLFLTPAQRNIAIAKFTAQFWVQPVVKLAAAA